MKGRSTIVRGGRTDPDPDPEPSSSPSSVLSSSGRMGIVVAAVAVEEVEVVEALVVAVVRKECRLSPSMTAGSLVRRRSVKRRYMSAGEEGSWRDR